MTRSPNSAWGRLKRRKWPALIVVWGLAVGIAAFIPDTATVREQVSAAAAVGELDEAMGDMAGLLAEEPHGYDITPLTRGEECTVSPVRPGEQFYRKTMVYTSKDDAKQLTKRLAKRLGKRYRLERAGVTIDDYPNYYGETPDFVQFSLAATPHGVAWQAETGCRPEGDEVGGVTTSFEPPSAAPAILRDLSVTSADWEKARTSCGDLGGPGGTSTSVRAQGRVTEEPDWDAVKALLPEDTEMLLDTSKTLTYRDGDTTWSVAVRGDEATVASTTACDG